MSNTLPESVDPWRMVQTRRVLEGILPLTELPRLLDLLAEPVGEVGYRVEFGRDEYDVPHIDIHAEAGLTLICQRTMSPFVQPIGVDQKLGLIRDESDEAALPDGYEALLVTDGQVCLKDVIEDELILALPLVALSPGAPVEQVQVTAGPEPEAEQPSNPFAVLGQLKNLQR
ncbi:MAG: YceD family protein [Dokdonella sp.]|uniref:YceD family protein n=1 Tax=Dokdonella sp. TaxID=2291710 RepID=UPI002C7D8B4C|nr:YceD family protein [Dokdonella sp.]HOX71028.1 YceD family protein [Dokdonella sp.]HPG95543.1 YceD family protein [Dokdonella sp.]